jgi:chromatin remodeling complex protein RSC6
MVKTDSTTRKLVKSKKKAAPKRVAAKKADLKSVQENTQAQEQPSEVVETPTAETEVKAKKVKKVVDRDTLFNDFDSLIQTITGEITSIRESGDKGRMQENKFLRATIKSLTAIKKTTTKVLKQKRRRKPVDGSKRATSGFLKPVPISEEMSKFASWNGEDLKSRVDVTKYICEYIREKNLQNPKDKRQIVPDAKLRKLLKFGAKDKSLTYYELQKSIQIHFPKKAVKV